MGFLGVYKAVYDYQPQSEGELAISEGDLLYVLEKSQEDDWWKAKKKAGGEDEDEPEGLIPNNYIEEANSSESYDVSKTAQLTACVYRFNQPARLGLCTSTPAKRTRNYLSPKMRNYLSTIRQTQTGFLWASMETMALSRRTISSLGKEARQLRPRKRRKTSPRLLRELQPYPQDPP
jgi:hypothetical protein